MLISLRGDAPTANLRPGKCCRRESTAADEQTGETRWELASNLDLGPGSAAAAANVAAVAATNAAAILRLETASTLANSQTMLISLRGDSDAPLCAHLCYLRPGVCCRRESTAADERTGGIRWELAAGG
jgi:hypothetical protein